MNILNSEDEVLLSSIIENEGWILIPGEDEFYNTLKNIKSNSANEFQWIIDNLIQKLAIYPYNSIKIELCNLLDYSERMSPPIHN